jgi:hypothetical protein
LASLACEGFFTQLWLQQFPQAGGSTHSAPALAKDIDALRQRLQVALQRKHKSATYKESFKTIALADSSGGAGAGATPNTDAGAGEEAKTEVVHFSLLVKPGAAPWHTLCEVERPRLKTARLAAYQLALKLLKQPAQN